MSSKAKRTTSKGTYGAGRAWMHFLLAAIGPEWQVMVVGVFGCCGRLLEGEPVPLCGGSLVPS
jgi:hypothetical protein